MADQFERATQGSKNVLVVSAQRHANRGRKCPKCGSVWIVEFEEGKAQLWRNGKREQSALLDASGRAAAVDCCPDRG